MIAISIFFQFYLSLILQFISEVKLYKKIIFIFTLLVFYVFFIGIKDTADWGMYDALFKYEDIETDFLFRFLSLIAFALGYSFEELFKLHVIIFGYFFVKFASRFTQNMLLVIGFYVMVAYVPLANQIRYFLALSLFFNGLYFFYFNQKKKSYLFFILAVLSHSSMVVLFTFMLVEKRFAFSEYIKKCIFLSLIVFFSYNFIVNLGLLDLFGKFKVYLVSSELVSSVLGGFLNEFPYIVVLTLLYFWLQKAIENVPELLEDKTFVFLYKLTFFSVIFIPISFNMQVIGHRYVQAFLIVWLCLFVYTLPFVKSKSNDVKNYLLISFCILFLMFYNYFFLGMIFGGKASYYEEFIKSYNSIEYLPDV